jgi:CelD/BcsL family acetyltransferase involved in cellulose biosynthesis
MHYALEQDVKVFDFTVGDEAYKREWCEIELKLYDHVSSSSLAGALAVSALDAARRAKRAIKQSPWLWPIAQRVRAKVRGQKPKAPEPVE